MTIYALPSLELFNYYLWTLEDTSDYYDDHDDAGHLQKNNNIINKYL